MLRAIKVTMQGRFLADYSKPLGSIEPAVAISLYLWYGALRWRRRHRRSFRDRLVVGQLTLDQSTVVRIHVPEPIYIWGLGDA